MRIPLFLLFLVLAAFAQSYAPSEGGNISAVNTTSDSNSSWHGICGQATPSASTPLAVAAVGGNVTALSVNTGSSACTAGIGRLVLLFSNSSGAITSLSRGNLSVLDAFIGRINENGTSTFLLSESFATANFGTITGVPTAYTNSPAPGTFRFGYLQDQNGNLVFIADVLSDRPGFNGTAFDFQLMLPTNNGSTVTYYVTADLLCLSENATPPSNPPGGGGGTHTPYYPGNATAPVEPPHPPENASQCDIILFCDEWGPCEGGFRQQACRDLSNCSNTEVYRVERCPLPPGNETIIPPVEEIPLIIIKPEFPCCLPLLILLLLIPVFAIERLRRRVRGGKQ